MEISVQGRHEEMVRPEIARLHAMVRAVSEDSAEVLRTATGVVNRVHAELLRLQQTGAVGQLVVRPISTSSWTPAVKGRPQRAIHQAQATLQADFTDFPALANLAATLGAVEGLELQRVEWRLTEQTMRRLNDVCLTGAVDEVRQRALVLARAAGEGGVRFVQLADPGLLSVPTVAQGFAAAPMAKFARGGGSADDVAGIDLHPEDLIVSAMVEARFTTTPADGV